VFEANEKVFGTCRRCGNSLADHLQRRSVDSDAYSSDAEYDAPFDDEIPPPPPGPCRSFTFQNGSRLCACGFEMSDHDSDDQGGSPNRLSLSINRMVRRVSKRFSNIRGQVVLSNPQGVACEHFSLNLQGEQYGLCKCGFNKLEHEKAHKQRQEVEAKEALVKKQKAIEARGDPTKPCKSFALDLANKEGYGVCQCGFRRDQHMDFTMHGEHQKVRGTLTAPKPFR